MKTLTPNKKTQNLFVFVNKYRDFLRSRKAVIPLRKLTREEVKRITEIPAKQADLIKAFNVLRNDLNLLNQVLERVLEAKSEKEKKLRISELKETVSLQLRNKVKFILNGNLNLVPASEKLSARKEDGNLFIEYTESEPFWWHAVDLCRDLEKHPSRLKLCLICSHFFFDETTKPANKTICYNETCAKKWAVQRVKKSPSYKTRSRKKSKKEK